MYFKIEDDFLSIPEGYGELANSDFVDGVCKYLKRYIELVWEREGRPEQYTVRWAKEWADVSDPSGWDRIEEREMRSAQ